MKIGTATGLAFSAFGIIAGIYFSVSPMLETSLSGAITGQQVGIQFAIVGTIIGLSCAAIGFIFNRATSNNYQLTNNQ